MTSAKFAAAGSPGALADRIGWFDFGAGFVLAPTGIATHIINALPGGYTAEFDIALVDNDSMPTDFVSAVPPVYYAAPFGQTGYVGINAPVVLYSNPTVGGAMSETITITNILVKNSKGVATTTYRFVAADAEETQETWSATTNGSVWALLDNLAPTNGNPPTSPTISGVGTATVSEVGVTTPPTHTSGPVYITNAPVAISGSATTAGRQAFAFGIITTDREQAISDLVESVALEQTALSHIINAEGEKIQKAVRIGNIDDMLDVNKSVKAMVKTVTKLELILQDKIDLFSCQICPPPARNNGTTPNP